MRKWLRLAVITGVSALACIMAAGVLTAYAPDGEIPGAFSLSDATQTPDAPSVSDGSAGTGVGNSTVSATPGLAADLASAAVANLDPGANPASTTDAAPDVAPDLSLDSAATTSPDTDQKTTPGPAPKPVPAPRLKPIAVLSDYEPFMGQIVGFALVFADAGAEYVLEATHLDDRLPTFPVGNRILSLIAIPPQATAGNHTLSVIAISGGDESVLLTIPYVIQKVTYTRQNISVSSETAAIRSDENLRLDNIKVGAAKSSTSPTPLWDGVFIQPVEGRISTQFGQQRYTNGVFTSRHSAIDIAVRQGTPIKAAASGRVIFADELIVSGNTVIIDHGLWLSTTYLHMSKILVSVGDVVSAGDIIGEVGSTGYSTGPHLHYSVDVRSQRGDPDMMKEKNPLDFGFIRLAPAYSFSKSSAPCLQSGQMKSLGSLSPSWT